MPRKKRNKYFICSDCQLNIVTEREVKKANPWDNQLSTFMKKSKIGDSYGHKTFSGNIFKRIPAPKNDCVKLGFGFVKEIWIHQKKTRKKFKFCR